MLSPVSSFVSAVSPNLFGCRSVHFSFFLPFSWTRRCLSGTDLRLSDLGATIWELQNWLGDPGDLGDLQLSDS